MLCQVVRALVDFFGQVMGFSEFVAVLNNFLYVRIVSVHFLHDGLRLSNKLSDGFNVLSSTGNSTLFFHDPILFDLDVVKQLMGLMRITQLLFSFFDQTCKCAVAFNNLVLKETNKTSFRRSSKLSYGRITFRDTIVFKSKCPLSEN